MFSLVQITLLCYLYMSTEGGGPLSQHVHNVAPKTVKEDTPLPLIYFLDLCHVGFITTREENSGRSIMFLQEKLKKWDPFLTSLKKNGIFQANKSGEN